MHFLVPSKICTNSWDVVHTCTKSFYHIVSQKRFIWLNNCYLMWFFILSETVTEIELTFACEILQASLDWSWLALDGMWDRWTSGTPPTASQHQSKEASNKIVGESSQGKLQWFSDCERMKNLNKSITFSLYYFFYQGKYIKFIILAVSSLA